MKEFKLSTISERVVGICFTAAMFAALAALIYAVRERTGLLIFCGLASLSICALLVIYVRSVLRAAAIVDADKKLLHVKGVKDFTADVKEATLLQTVARKNGQSVVRQLVFSGADERIVAVVPTMFTSKQGIWADPMAKEIAAELGIAFQQNVPDWQLDKKKYQEHMKAEAERQRREVKERRQKKKESRIQKRKNQLK